MRSKIHLLNNSSDQFWDIKKYAKHMQNVIKRGGVSHYSRKKKINNYSETKGERHKIVLPAAALHFNNP
jgi:hypothetical protein